MTENSPTSAGIESEYDTASTNSRSDNEQDEYEEDEEDSLDDEATGMIYLFHLLSYKISRRKNLAYTKYLKFQTKMKAK